MGGLVYVAMLYVVSACALLIGAGDAFIYARYSLRGVDGTMTSTDPGLQRIAKYVGDQATYAHVVYHSAEGDVDVPRKFIRAAHVKRLARGDAIPVRFLRSDPESVLYDRESPPLSLGWLIFGGVAMSVAIVAHILLRRDLGARSS